MTSIRSALAVGGIALCTPCALASATTGDFDGDRRDELLLRNADTGAWLYYDLEDGGGAAHVLPLPTSDDQRFLGIGDFNGDGRDDVLFTRRDTRSWTYYALQAPGSAPLAIPSEALPVTSNPVFEFRGVGDLDGDGDDDLLLRNTDNGVWIAYFVDGADLELRRGLGATPRQVWAFAGMGDFNDDGGDDLLLRNTDTAAWVHYEMGANGRGVLRRPGLTRNRSFALRGIGDLNGDGRDDLLLRNRDNHGRGVTRKVTVAGLPEGASIEAVMVEVDLDHPFRHDLEMRLASPSGTPSTLNTPYNDALAFDFSTYRLRWRLLGNAFYGEPPNGDWRLLVFDGAEHDTGTLEGWRIRFYYGEHPR